MLDRFPVPSFARSSWRPAADVYRTEEGWLIKVELAGVNVADLQVEVRGRWLIVSGQRRDVQLQVGCRCHSLEISYDRFERSFEFPCEISATDPQIQFENGMLWLRVQNCQYA